MHVLSQVWDQEKNLESLRNLSADPWISRFDEKQLNLFQY